MPDGVHHQVGSGTHRFTAPVAPDGVLRDAVGLDSSLADIVDDDEARARLFAAMSRFDPDAVGWWRRRTRWVPGRTLRSALLMTPPAAVAAVQAELAELTRTRNAPLVDG
jgi:alpha-L-rhamnosidase